MRFLGRSLLGLFLFVLTLGLFAVAGGTVWRALEARWAEAPPERENRERVYAVRVIAPEAARVAPVIETFGEIRSRRTLELRSGAGGRIVWMSDAFVEGGRVEAGQLLARIDDADPKGRLRAVEADLAEAEADLAEAQRNAGLAEEELASFEDQAGLRERALDRQRDLERRGVGTAAAVETAEIAAQAARQAVLARRRALAEAEARIAQAGTALERARIDLAEAERRVAETEIWAPFSGTLAEVERGRGALVSPNERLADLIDPGALEASFRLSAAQYARLLDGSGRLGPATVRASLDAGGLDIAADGRITRDSPAVGEDGTGRLIFAALDGAAAFRPGDFVTIRVAEPPLDDVADLPAAALGADGRVLAVGDGDRLESVEAPLLRRQGDRVLVPAAAVAGREIVAERTPFLGAGILVRPIRPEADGEDAGTEEMVELDVDRRARLIAFVEASERMPDGAKARVLAELRAPLVAASTVARIEAWMGG